MFTKIFLLLTIIAYCMIVSQSFMYIIALKNVQNAMAAPSYIELRQLLDTSFRANFKYPIYIALVCNLILLISTVKQPTSLLFVCAAIAFVALVIDVVLALKGNVPINELINTWTTTNYPADWQTYREKWLRIYSYRQVADITGFVALIVGTVFGSK